MSLSVIDILFLVTVLLLVFNGLRNGAIFSLINLLSIPIGFAAAQMFGGPFTQLLAANGVAVTPFIAYVVVFFGAALILHIIATSVRSFVQKLPIIGFGDSLAGGALGFVEAWLLWVVFLMVLGGFLSGVQHTVAGIPIPGVTIQIDQLRAWNDFYNQAVTNSLFARVNLFLFPALSSFVPSLPHL